LTPIVQISEIEAAARRISGKVHRTPTMTASTLGRMVGANLLLKAELLQKTGSFKVRGVLNHLLGLSPTSCVVA